MILVIRSDAAVSACNPSSDRGTSTPLAVLVTLVEFDAVDGTTDAGAWVLRRVGGASFVLKKNFRSIDQDADGNWSWNSIDASTGC